jgi:hypothetical protein
MLQIMGRLANILQNYYRTKGNKIVFKNGLTLNGLAVQMWERLEYKEIDSSVLSRVIHGQRLFTYKQLEVFCEALSLQEKEKTELKYALSQDILSRSNINTDIFRGRNSTFYLDRDNYDHIPNILKLLRKDGHPEEVVSLSQTFENIIDSKSYLQNEDKKILGKIYNEKSRAFGETSSPQKVFSLMNALNKRAVEFGEEANDREILDMAYMNVGGAYYVAKGWRDSSMFLESKFKKVSAKTQLEFVRTLLLDYAYQKDYSRFKEALGKTIKIIDKDSNNKHGILASIYEAIARSLAIFGFTKEARKILEKAEKLNLDPFYESQILRGYIFTFCFEKSLSKAVDYDQLNIIQKRSQEEKFVPYKRHRSQIEKMIKQINASLL